MMTPEFWSESWTAAVVNHLWQSTAVACVAWLLALALKGNQARVRYWVWIIASVKFLVPFSLLMMAGEWLRSLVAMSIVEKPALAHVMEQIAQPFQQAQHFDVTHNSITSDPVNLLPVLLLAIWICGALIVILRWARGWGRIRAAVRTASPLALTADVPVLSSHSLLEPGVFGILRPLLLLPEGIVERLTPEQLRAIIAHEMCHVRRRDNLTFALHMIVEALCWFHPAVWWIGARLIDEREHACDEAVLREGSEAQVYAEGILNVCKFYIESPVACASGVSGADLKKRIVRIMAGHGAQSLDFSKKLLLGAAAVVLVAAPFAEGLADDFHLHAQLLLATDSPRPSFEVATIRPSLSDSDLLNFRLSFARFSAENVSLTRLIRFAYDVKSDDQLAKGPGWMSSEKFDIDAKIGDAQVDAMKKLPPDQRFNQYRFMVQSLLADRFKVKVSTEMKEIPVYALVVAKNGARLTQAPLPAGSQEQHMPQLTGASRGELNASAVPMAFFAEWLSGKPDAGGRVVIDATGLAGSYDFALKWAPADSSTALSNGTNAGGDAARAPADSSGPSLFTALQEQLGLKLESRKAPVQVLVIDHIEQPSPN